MYSANAQQSRAYALNVADIHLRSGTTLPTPKPPLIIEVPNIPIAQIPANVTSSAQNQPTIGPPFQKKLIQTVPTQIKE